MHNIRHDHIREHNSNIKVMKQYSSVVLRYEIIIIKVFKLSKGLWLLKFQVICYKYLFLSIVFSYSWWPIELIVNTVSKILDNYLYFSVGYGQVQQCSDDGGGVDDAVTCVVLGVSLPTSLARQNIPPHQHLLLASSLRFWVSAFLKLFKSYWYS